MSSELLPRGQAVDAAGLKGSENSSQRRGPEEAPVFITRRASGEGWSAPKETGTDSKTGTESKDTKESHLRPFGYIDVLYVLLVYVLNG